MSVHTSSVVCGALPQPSMPGPNDRSAIIWSKLMNSSPQTLRVRDWDVLYENNRSRALQRLNWVLVPNDIAGDGYVDLVGNQNGAAHLGVWHAVLMVASRAPKAH